MFSCIVRIFLWIQCPYNVRKSNIVRLTLYYACGYVCPQHADHPDSERDVYKALNAFTRHYLRPLCTSCYAVQFAVHNAVLWNEFNINGNKDTSSCLLISWIQRFFRSVFRDLSVDHYHFIVTTIQGKERKYSKWLFVQPIHQTPIMVSKYSSTQTIFDSSLLRGPHPDQWYVYNTMYIQYNVYISLILIDPFISM